MPPAPAPASAPAPVFAAVPCDAPAGVFADLAADATALLGTSRGEDGVCWGLIVAGRDEFDEIAALRLVRQSPDGRLELRLQPPAAATAGPGWTDGRYEAAELTTGDLDGDGRQEAQLSLTWGRGVQRRPAGQACAHGPCFVETRETVQERLLVTFCAPDRLGVLAKRLVRYESASSASEEIDQVPGAEEGVWTWELLAGLPPRLGSQQQRLTLDPHRLPGLLDPRPDPGAAGPAALPLPLDPVTACAASPGPAGAPAP